MMSWLLRQGLKGMRRAVFGGLVAGGVYLLWQRSQREVEATPPPPPERARDLLLRGAAVLRLPTSPERVPEALADGSGLRCPVTGRSSLIAPGSLTCCNSSRR